MRTSRGSVRLLVTLVLLGAAILPYAAAAQPGPDDWVMLFRGSDVQESGAAGVDSGLDLGPQLSVVLWIYRLEELTDWTGFLEQDNASGIAYAISLDVGGTLLANVQGDSTQVGLASPAPLPLADWTQIALTVDGSEVHLYVDGSEVDTDTLAGGMQAVSASPFSIVGKEIALSGLQIWNRALSQPEIVTYQTSEPTGTETDLAAYWPLDEHAGLSAANLVAGSPDLRLGFIDEPDSGDPGFLPAHFLDEPPYFAVHSISVPDSFDGIALDLDDDHDLDLLRWGQVYDNLIDTPPYYELPPPSPTRAYENVGGFVFTPRLDWLESTDFQVIGAGGYLLPTGDLDGDNRPDALIADYGPDQLLNGDDYPGGLVTIYMRSATDGLLDESDSRMSQVPAKNHAIRLGDLDGDHDLDFLLGRTEDARPTYGTTFERTQAIYLNDGDGYFTEAVGALPDGYTWEGVDPTPSNPKPSLLDLDNDGDLDIFTGWSQENGAWDRVLENNGSGVFSWLPEATLAQRPAWANSSIWAVAGDFNHDGHNDFLVQLENVPATMPVWQIQVSNGDGTFHDGTAELLPDAPWDEIYYTHGVTVADINDDGCVDLVAPKPGGLVLFWGKDGGFQYYPGLTSFAGTEGRATVQVADIDNDGDLDLINQTSDSMTFAYENLRSFRFCLFLDGFESGDTSAWDATVPAP